MLGRAFAQVVPLEPLQSPRAKRRASIVLLARSVVIKGRLFALNARQELMETVPVWSDVQHALLEASALRPQARSVIYAFQGSFRLATPTLALLVQVELLLSRQERLRAVRAPTMPCRTPS